ncbi:hypothetical protein FA95DRAFT_1562159 [Auriscalpium vulgare]|uniref:Uncharacterized protein n=1 Tax=Auriscalpium vulgare TaxID=40419 RepID=A0ACB8RLY1_9AGAM|nr:hypothetical protein FA95DRAFT_1562159 [Auriscalpium vulgare]
MSTCKLAKTSLLGHTRRSSTFCSASKGEGIGHERKITFLPPVAAGAAGVAVRNPGASWESLKTINIAVNVCDAIPESQSPSLRGCQWQGDAIGSLRCTAVSAWRSAGRAAWTRREFKFGVLRPSFCHLRLLSLPDLVRSSVRTDRVQIRL